jgi:hypothetical protein
MLASQADAAPLSPVISTDERPLTAAGPEMQQICGAQSGAIHPVIEKLPRVAMLA